MTYTRIINNWVTNYTIGNGATRITSIIRGLNCPHCKRFILTTDEDSMVDAQEHVTYCSPAHQRAECGEEF